MIERRWPLARWLATVGAAVVAMGFVAPGGAQPGTAGAARAVVGMSAPLTGPHAAYGAGLLQGVKLGLNHGEGDAGGGRSIELLVRDDAGQAQAAEANTRALIAAGALVLTGYHGAASVEAALPQMTSSGTPMLGASSSAESLRQPPHRLLFNLRAGSGEEMAAIMYQLDTQGIEKVAILAQGGSLGDAALEAMKLDLLRIGLRPAAEIRPRADDPQAVAQAMRTACGGTPEAVLLVLNKPAAVAALRAARASACVSRFVVLSETGAALTPEEAAAGEWTGVIVSQVLPHPSHQAHALVAAYRQALAKEPGAKPSYPSLEGYLYGRAVAAAVRQCSQRLTRGCITETLESRGVDLPGWRLSFGPEQRRGARFVELTMVDAQGRFKR